MPLLHDALESKKPDAEVKTLITSAAAKEKDNDGRLPLHWAARENTSAEVVKLVYDAHPGAAKEKDNVGKLPRQCALKARQAAAASSSRPWGTSGFAAIPFAVALERAGREHDVPLTPALKRLSHIAAHF